MSFWNKFGKPSGRHGRRGSDPSRLERSGRRRFRAALERLEDRTLLAYVNAPIDDVSRDSLQTADEVRDIEAAPILGTSHRLSRCDQLSAKVEIIVPDEIVGKTAD